MDNYTFGITMTVVGTGATFLILGILVFVISLLKKVFPVSAEANQTEKAKGA